MLDKAMMELMAQGIWDTCYMTIVATFFGYVIGLPLGIALTLTDENGITPNRAVYRILDIIINITRSIPFLILLILVMPLTKLLVGKTYGSTATIVRLCNHIGYPGYRDFRQAVAYELAVRDQTKRHQQQAIERNDSL